MSLSLFFRRARAGHIAGMLVMLVSFTADAQQPPAGWEWQNPIPPPGLHFVRTPDSDDILLHARGVFWRSTDNGNSWTSFRGPVTSNHACFVNSEIGWAVGRFGAVSVTTDAGRTWEAQKSGSTTNLLEAFFVNRNYGWIRADSGTVLRTTDGGANWTKYESTNPKQSCFFVDDSLGWLMIYNGTSVLIGKENFNNTKRNMSYSGGFASPHPPAFFFINPRQGWAVGNSNMVMRSIDSGKAWYPVVVGTSHRFTALHFIDEYTGWVVGTGGCIAKTTDGGTQWSIQNSGCNDTLRQVRFKNASEGWITGDRATILATTDGGTTWKQLQKRSPDHILKIIFPDAQQGYAATAGGILATSNGGADWLEHKTGDTVRGIFALNAGICFAVSASGVRRTVDGGQTWPIISQEQCTAVSFVDVNTGCALFHEGAYGGVLSTRDGGSTWTRRYFGSRLYWLAFTDQTTCWAAGDGRLLIKSTDAGETWSATGGGSEGAFVDVQFLSGDTAVAAYTRESAGGYNLFRTTNGGVSWAPSRVRSTMYPLSTDAKISSIQFWTVDRGICVDQYGTLYRTSDGGRVWTAEQLFGYSQPWQPPSQYLLSDAWFINGYTGWVCGQDGTILKYTGDPTGVEGELVSTPTGIFVSPHPFAGRARVQFSLEQPGRVRLGLYSMLGELRQELADRDFPQGMHVLPFSTALPDGLYFLQIRTDHDVRTQKLLLIR